MDTAAIDATDAWNPQAIFRAPIESFVRPGLTWHEGVDGLDTYRGVFGTIDGLEVALKVHPGNPNGMVSIYFRPEIDDLAEITALVRRAVAAFSLEERDVWWERRDGLDEPPKPKA